MTTTSSDQPPEREMLLEAQAKGTAATLATYMRLSGPGWLQSAITLGGGSLAGALFLGVLGGTSLLWLQLIAISMGVVMLSAISYVTLSTGERPFRAINRHINPVLGWGWLIATIMANMIWCMPQFSLCFAALQKNLLGPETVSDARNTKLFISLIMFLAAGIAVFFNSRHGKAAKLFDLFLKLLVGMIVICFFGVVVLLGWQGFLNWNAICSGFVPNVSSWTQPTGEIARLLADSSDVAREFWSHLVVKEQRAVMIAAAATAVGINMTFLMPYTMLNRGWSKPFRGLARFDLCTGMAIPYVLVTSCVVIASAATFHAKIDDTMLSSDPTVLQGSPTFAKAEANLRARVAEELGQEEFDSLSENQQLQMVAQLPEAEKRVAASLVRRDAFQLSKALAPLLGERTASLVFGIGIFGMGFSTIIILMLINGFAFSEMFNRPLGGTPHIIGCLVAGASGALWPLVWDEDAKLWLAILASSFGMMLLPIAYVTFFMMMNSTKLMGDEKPRGLSMVIWNVLMVISVCGAIVAAGTAIYDKMNDSTVLLTLGTIELTAGRLVIGVAIVFAVLVILGFVMKKRESVAV